MKNKNFAATIAGLSILTALLFNSCVSAPENKIMSAQEYILAGEIEKAKSLFTNQADINLVDADGNTALHMAARINEPDLTTFLIIKGADMELKNNAGDTALHVAVKGDCYEAARALTEMGADIFALDAEGFSALESSTAKSEVYYDIMINEKTSKQKEANTGNGIVHYFVNRQNKKAIDYCINKNIPIDNKNSSGLTPLALALKDPKNLVQAQIAADLILAGAETVNCKAIYFEEAVEQRNMSLRMSDGQTPLHFAAIYGHSGISQYLLDNGADTKAQDISGATPLHEACRYGNAEIAKQLIEKGADVNGQDSLGKTPLLLLIPESNQQEIYSILLESGANVNQKDMYGDTILHVASMSNVSPETLGMFAGAGADINIRNKKGLTPIATSIEHGRNEQVNFFAANGADIHAEDARKNTPLISVLKRPDDMYKFLVIKENASSIDSEGNTPLLVALKNNASFDRIQYIADLDSNVNARNRDGESALFVAVEKNNRKAGELLLSRNADIFAANTQNISPLRKSLESQNESEQWLINSTTIQSSDGSGNSVLHYASEWHLPNDVMNFLIQKGANVNAVNGNGETPLFSAAKADNTDAIDSLVKSGASLAARDNLGSSPLHAAVRWNSLTAAEKLINMGLNIDCQNVGGKTPLAEAAVEGNITMAKLLLRHGANPNTYDQNGRTCLSDAIRGGQYDMVKLLLLAKANPQIQDLSGRTPCHEAATLGDKAMIELLKKAGANPLARDKAGRTPLSIAFGKDQDIMYALLGDDRMIADSDGNTPVHIAIQKRAKHSILVSLVEKGYPFDTRNSSGWTPLALAAISKQKDAAAFLLEKGADPFAKTSSKGESVLSLAFKEKSGYLLGYIVKNSRTKTDIRGNTILHYAARLADEETVSRLLRLGLSKRAKNVSGETPYDVAVNWKKDANAALLDISPSPAASVEESPASPESPAAVTNSAEVESDVTASER